MRKTLEKAGKLNCRRETTAAREDQEIQCAHDDVIDAVMYLESGGREREMAKNEPTRQIMDQHGIGGGAEEIIFLS